jgi:hypothetical protein
MGAAASIECTKPVDASEIRSTNDLEISKAEIIRLRHLLGHLAKGTYIIKYSPNIILNYVPIKRLDLMQSFLMQAI